MKRLTLALAVAAGAGHLTVSWLSAPRPPRTGRAPRRPPRRRRRSRGARPPAAAASKIDKGDTAWMLTSSALVLMMTAPGLALFYGGMVRQKNALGTLMHSFIIAALISVQWVLWGYSLAFGPDKGGIIGGLEWVGLQGVGLEPFDTYSKTIPHQAFMLFQMMFAIITPALITGAFAERKKFSAFLLFTLLWATFVYDPLAHWVWADGGWLKKLGRARLRGRHRRPHLLGRVGARLRAHDRQAPGLRPPADAAPQPADDGDGRGAAVVRLVRLQRRQRARGQRPGGQRVHGDQHRRGRGGARLDVHGVDEPRASRPCSAPPRAPSPASSPSRPPSGYVSPMASIIIGAVAGALCYAACNLKTKLGYDDSLDVVGVHGVGGTWGALATGLFASKAINEAGGDGLFYGNPGQLWTQIVAVLATYVLAIVGTAVILKIVDASSGCGSATRTRWSGWTSPSTRRRRTRWAADRTASSARRPAARPRRHAGGREQAAGGALRPRRAGGA